MRQIVLDTETTGISYEQGHRIIEIGCLELLDRQLTGNHFHVYLNPERDIDAGAFKTHGISLKFLQDKPLFKDVLKEFLQFIEGSELIIHNAPFDVGFLNTELMLAEWPKILEDHCGILDTLILARKKHPGQRNSLDALCKRYEINHADRQLHGALLDAEILASVYLAMTGGQTELFFEENPMGSDQNASHAQDFVSLAHDSPVKLADSGELVRHQQFIEFIVKQSGINHWKN